jgi:phenylalanyl-tRNA synthetase beta chain
MRVPLRWLGEFVDLAPGSTPEDVHAALVRVGLEEEDIHEGECVGPIVVGEVLEFDEEPQKNGKTIRWCHIRVAADGVVAPDGGASVRGIVCGARNFVIGDKIIVALPGAVLPGPFPIAARKTYGHVSDGMIASARELGLGDDHDGILRLSTLGLNPDVGTDGITLLGLDDSAVEINVTPDRGYAFSIRGVAREYSHATGAVFRDPTTLVTVERGTGFNATVVDDAPIRGRVGCSIFVTRVVRGVNASLPTPGWMVFRLRLAGIRPVSFVVDVTNYVMLEFGQPIHAYDLDRVRGGIVVRRAVMGEVVVTLDEKERMLDPEDLVIADVSGVIGLAGVMGGTSTEINAGTTNVLVEAANFDPVSIARTVRRQKLSTEASKRFERGVDPMVAEAAAARVVELLVSVGGCIPDSLGSFIGTFPTPVVIELPGAYIPRRVGVEYTANEIRGALEQIGAIVTENDEGVFVVTAPSWRPDLVDKASLAEEVARINGYDRIPSVLPTPPPGRGLTRSQRLRIAASTVLASNGVTEVVAYPFVSTGQVKEFSSIRGGICSPVRLANPLDAEHGLLRVSVLPGLIDVAHRNFSRGLTDLALFEQGLVFLPEDGVTYGVTELPIGTERPEHNKLAELMSRIPAQPRHIGGVFLGNAWPKQPTLSANPYSWHDAVTAVEQVAHAVNAKIYVRNGIHPAYHPGRTAEIVAESTRGLQLIGYAGELLPALTERATYCCRI